MLNLVKSKKSHKQLRSKTRSKRKLVKRRFNYLYDQNEQNECEVNNEIVENFKKILYRAKFKSFSQKNICMNEDTDSQKENDLIEKIIQEDFTQKIDRTSIKIEEQST